MKISARNAKRVRNALALPGADAPSHTTQKKAVTARGMLWGAAAMIWVEHGFDFIPFVPWV